MKFNPALIYETKEFLRKDISSYYQCCLLANSMDALRVYYEPIIPSKVVNISEISMDNNYFYYLGEKFLYLYPLKTNEIPSKRSWFEENDFDVAWNKYKKPYKEIIDFVYDPFNTDVHLSSFKEIKKEVLDKEKMIDDWDDWSELHNQKIKLVFV